MPVHLQSAPFDPGVEFNAFLAQAESAGAAVTFTGLVRSLAGSEIESMTLEHYPELAERQIGQILGEATTRFALLDAVVIHRFGELFPDEPIMQVMTLALHRREAFEGAEFLMDYLKTDAPFWKLEKSKGESSWVAAKEADDRARERW